MSEFNADNACFLTSHDRAGDRVSEAGGGIEGCGRHESFCKKCLLIQTSVWVKVLGWKQSFD